MVFTAGSAHDPAGKEGLAALTAAMITDAGSRAMTIDQIEAVLYPDGRLVYRPRGQGADRRSPASSIGTTGRSSSARCCRSSSTRASATRISRGSRTRSSTRSCRTFGSEQRGGARQGAAPDQHLPGHPYGHVALGTAAGVDAITLDDVRQFAKDDVHPGEPHAGASGDAPEEMVGALQSALATLPAGGAAARVAVQRHAAAGTDVEILEKDTRATAISLGFPIDVTRAHPDFAALSIARAWLGEHRIAPGASISASARSAASTTATTRTSRRSRAACSSSSRTRNVARQRQIFEIWIRPVVPVNAHMTLRIAIHELDRADSERADARPTSRPRATT